MLISPEEARGIFQDRLPVLVQAGTEGQVSGIRVLMRQPFNWLMKDVEDLLNATPIVQSVVDVPSEAESFESAVIQDDVVILKHIREKWSVKDYYLVAKHLIAKYGASVQ